MPFYDSFLYNNLVIGNNCVPDFSFISPTFFLESNGLFIDKMIKTKVDKFASDKFNKQEVKSIYYKKREDFFAWQTYKCIKNGENLRAPNMKMCGSKEFCVESWKEVKDTGLIYE